MSTTALVLIDIQHDYFAGGRMPLWEPEAAADTAGRVLARFRRAGMPVVHVRHESRAPGATFFLPGTDGLGFHPAVAPTPDEVVITKHYPNAFRGTPLATWLQSRGVAQLVIVGMMTHMCIDTTVRAAADLAFTNWVVSDATATRALAHAGREIPGLDVAGAFLAALDGTFGRVVAADDPRLPGASGG